MREDWNRTTPLLTLDNAALTHLIQPAFPGAAVLEAAPAEGGLANTNLRLRLSHQDAPVLLRLFVRDPGAAAKEAALHELLQKRVAVPRYLYFAPENSVTGHPYALMEWIVGERLEVVAPHLKTPQSTQMGRAIGQTLARVHAVTFSQVGFFGNDLSIAQPITMRGQDLVFFLRQCLTEGRGAARLGESLTEKLLRFAEAKAHLLDTENEPPCLVHGDFGGSNILVREENNIWRVAAILDWEFSFSGTPFFDLGNLLRPPLENLPGFADAVAAGYQDADGKLPQLWRQMSRLTDLTAWADFLNRETINDALLASAAQRIRQTVAEWG